MDGGEQEVKDEIEELASVSKPIPKDVHYIIYSDGSGSTDHFGGYAAIAVTPSLDDHCYIASCGCATHTEVGRAEFMAVLNSLHSIFDVRGINKHSSAVEMCENLGGRRIRVHIVSDREDLVGSINGMYSRKSNPDLWAQFAWYEQYMDITASHTKRETNPTQSLADKTASLMRCVLKDFVDMQSELNRM